MINEVIPWDLMPSGGGNQLGYKEILVGCAIYVPKK
jgi:hypothetical protein